MNTTFRQLLTRPDAHGHCRIFLDVTWPKHRVKKPTGVSCRPEHFQADARPGKWVATKDPAATDANAKLAQLLADVAALFRLADAQGQAVTTEQALALGKPEPDSDAPGALPNAPASPRSLKTATFLDLHQIWKSENPHQGFNSGRRYNQVLGHLQKFHPGMGPHQLTRQVYLEYLHYLSEIPVADSTVLNHVKFLRECHRLTNRAIPTWLKSKTKYGRAPALRREELLHLLTAEMPRNSQELAIERDVFLFQLFTLLRDADLRELQPHHVTRGSLPGVPGVVYLLDIYQDKTADPVRIPLCPQAVAIWERYDGRLPVDTNQERNRRIKDLGCAVGLDRNFVHVKFYKGKPREEVGPLYQFLKTHAARHSGADMVLWGGEGDQNLKELALGHAEGASVYGYDTLERYGPKLLKAWENVLGAPTIIAPKQRDSADGLVITCAPSTAILRPVLVRSYRSKE